MNKRETAWAQRKTGDLNGETSFCEASVGVADAGKGQLHQDHVANHVDRVDY